MTVNVQDAFVLRLQEAITVTSHILSSDHIHAEDTAPSASFDARIQRMLANQRLCPHSTEAAGTTRGGVSIHSMTTDALQLVLSTRLKLDDEAREQERSRVLSVDQLFETVVYDPRIIRATARAKQFSLSALLPWYLQGLLVVGSVNEARLTLHVPQLENQLVTPASLSAAVGNQLVLDVQNQIVRVILSTSLTMDLVGAYRHIASGASRAGTDGTIHLGCTRV